MKYISVRWLLLKNFIVPVHSLQIGCQSVRKMKTESKRNITRKIDDLSIYEIKIVFHEEKNPVLKKWNKGIVDIVFISIVPSEFTTKKSSQINENEICIKFKMKEGNLISCKKYYFSLKCSLVNSKNLRYTETLSQIL